jgi:hypothetical protein
MPFAPPLPRELWDQIPPAAHRLPSAGVGGADDRPGRGGASRRPANLRSIRPAALTARGTPLPGPSRRSHPGPATRRAQPGHLEWRRPNRATLLNLFHHPAYAGAYRYGHRQTDPRRKQPGRPSSGRLIRRPEECLVLVRDRVPAYIAWGGSGISIGCSEPGRLRRGWRN